MSKKQEDTILQILRFVSASCLETIATRVPIPIKTLRIMAKDYNYRVRKMVAASPYAPPELLKTLAGDKAISVLAALIMNDNFPNDLAEELYDNNPRLQDYNGIIYTHRPKIISKAIANNKDTNNLVLHNSSVTPDDLDMAYANGDVAVKISVAKKHFITLKTQWEIIKGKEYGPKHYLLLWCSDEVILNFALAQNDDRLVTAMAQNVCLSAEMYHKIYSYKPKSTNERLDCLAQNPKTPPDILRKLYKINRSSMHVDLAGNPNTPLDVIAELSNSSDKSIIRKLFDNKNLTTSIATKLFSKTNDKWLIDRRYAVANTVRKTNKAILFMLARHSSSREGYIFIILYRADLNENDLIRLTDCTDRIECILSIGNHINASTKTLDVVIDKLVPLLRTEGIVHPRTGLTRVEHKLQKLAEKKELSSKALDALAPFSTDWVFKTMAKHESLSLELCCKLLRIRRLNIYKIVRKNSKVINKYLPELKARGFKFKKKK